MDWVVGVIGGVIGIVAGVSGMYLGWAARARAQKRDARTDGCEDGELKSDVGYIKRGIDDIRLDMKDHRRKLEGLTERVARVEESTKSAHHRLDRIEKKEE